MGVKIAIIGYGGMGGYHARLLKDDTSYELAGVYDIDESRLAIAESNGINTFATEDELFKSGINAAVIATPNDIHPYYAVKLAQAGINIVCEKPAAITSAEFVNMARESQRHNIILTVHQNRRWDKDFITAKKIIESGIIGNVYRVESRVTGANGIPDGWRKIKAHGGGMMLDWGVHLIDQICFLKEAPINYLYCNYSYILGNEAEDGFKLILEHTDGFCAEITVDTNSYVALPRWTLYGTSGSAVIEDFNCKGRILVNKNSTEIIKGVIAGNGFTKTMAKRPDSSVQEYELPDAEVDYKEFYRNFAACCSKTAVPAVDNISVLRVLKIMEAAEKAARGNIIIKGESL